VAEELREPDGREADATRDGGKRDHRSDHRPVPLVQVLVLRRALEDAEVQARHVEGGEPGCDEDSGDGQVDAVAKHLVLVEQHGEDLVLGEEAGPREHAGKRERADCEGRPRPPHVPA